MKHIVITPNDAKVTQMDIGLILTVKEFRSDIKKNARKMVAITLLLFGYQFSEQF